MREGAPAWAGRQICFALLVSLAVSPEVSAEDNRSWSFEVVRLQEIDDRRTVIHLRPIPPGKRYPRSCKELVLHAEFDPTKMTPEQRSFLYRRGHDEAIRLLREADLTKKLVRIGSMDTGFGAIPGRPRCEVASRGLRVLSEDEGGRAIYSFH